jgi:hypothetical protein
MALGMIVPTKFTLQDKMTGPLGSLRGKMKKFSAGASADFRSVAAEASRLSDIVKGSALGSLLSKGITATTRVIRQNIGSAISYASNLVEAQNVVATVFGADSPAAKAIESFSKTATKKFGLTALQAKNYTSTLGSILGGMGISGDLQVGMATKLAGRIGDISSLFNIGQEDAFEKIRSGLTGQTAPLKSLGVVMTQASLDAFALSKGVKTAWKDMSQAAQTALRFSFIMEKTAKAEGDASKPIASWAYSSRQLTLAFDEMRGKLASGLLPTLIEGADKITGFIRRISEWADANQKIIATKAKMFARTAVAYIKTIIPWVKSAVGFFLKFGPAILTAYAAFTVFSKVVVMINAVSSALTFMGTALTIATGPIGLIAAALAAVGVGLGLVIKMSATAAMGNRPAVERYRDAARTMVAENEAARIEAERLGHTGQAASIAVGDEAERKYAGSIPILTNRDLLAAGAADPRNLSAGEWARERAQQDRYRIASPLAGQVGNLTVDEAFRVQATKWADEDRFNRATLTGKDLSGYLAANPEEITYEEALKRLRESAATASVGGGDMDPELKKMLEEANRLLADIKGGVNGLNDGSAQGAPGRLDYRAMGQEDFFSIARKGFY